MRNDTWCAEKACTTAPQCPVIHHGAGSAEFFCHSTARALQRMETFKRVEQIKSYQFAVFFVGKRFVALPWREKEG